MGAKTRGEEGAILCADVQDKILGLHQEIHYDEGLWICVQLVFSHFVAKNVVRNVFAALFRP